MVTTYDAVVIGAGTMGSSTAWWLARQGRSVLLAERFEQGHVRGSSHGGVRIFRLAYDTPSYVRMAQAALPLWRELEDDADETLLELTGAVDHGPLANIQQIAAALTECSVKHELLAPDEAKARFPSLNFAEAVLFHPDSGRCFADRTVAALQRRAADHGADVRFNCTARIIDVKEEGVEVDAGGGTVRARVAVVTAGAWVSDVLAGWDVGELPPFEVTQEQVVHFPPRDPDAVWPSFIHHESPWRYGLHTPGEGVKVGGHHEGPVVTGDTRDFVLDDRRLAEVVAYAARWLPGVVPEPQFGATCLYTNTPDESFVLDRRGPIVIGSPCSGHGFKFTPLIGQTLATLAVVT